MAKMTKAEADVVARKVNAYFNPKVDGERVYRDEPTVVQHDFMLQSWVVMWEGGPSEWAYHVDGSTSQEDWCLLVEAGREFGFTPKRSSRKPLALAAGVCAEPYTSYALLVYKEEL